MARWAMEWPSVARRSPAITTPSAKRRATTVVECRMVSSVSRIVGTAAVLVRASNDAKSGPGSSGRGKSGSATWSYWPPFWT